MIIRNSYNFSQQLLNQVTLWPLCQLDGNVGDELVDRGHRSRNKRPPAAQSRLRKARSADFATFSSVEGPSSEMWPLVRMC